MPRRLNQIVDVLTRLYCYFQYYCPYSCFICAENIENFSWSSMHYNHGSPQSAAQHKTYSLNLDVVCGKIT